MTLYVPGTTNVEDLVRFDWDEADAIIAGGTKPTVEVGMWLFIPRNVVTHAGDTTHRLAGIDDGSNGGLHTQIGSSGLSAFNIRVRTTITNSHNSPSVNATIDEMMWFAYRIDYVTGELKFFHDGAQIGDTIVLDEGDTWRGDGFRPMIRGRRADSKDIEWVEIAYWNNSNDLEFANADNYVPTEAQLLAYTAGDDISSWPDPKSHVKPTGTNGAVATTFADLVAGGRVFNLTTGQTSGIYAPYFVGTEEIGAGSYTPSSLAVDLAYSVGVTGTTHIMVGLASANASNPTPSQIKLGQNQNGTSATVKEAFTESSTGQKERRLTGLFGSINYKAFAVIETETDEFTSVISWTFTTPRIGLRTDPIYTPGSSPALWASQTAINIAVAAQGMPSVVDTAETDSSGRLVVDLSEAPGFYLPVGGAAKVGWEKGSNFGFQSATIENLDE